MSTFARWQRYWAEKSNPLLLGAEEDELFVRDYARELRLLLPEQSPASVLEIGCGCGTFYEPLGFSGTRYRGVDGSPAMLDRFARDYPETSLVCADGSAYQDSERYDLIFSNGVLQYLTPQMVQRHYELAEAMLSPGGVLVSATVPLKALQWAYRTGEVHPPHRADRLRAVLRTLRFSLQPDPLGFWYSYEDLQRLAQRVGLVGAFYNSMHYRYRFHAVFRRG